MAYTRNNDVRLYYEVQGEGDPLVLIMGLGGSVEAWGMQLPAFCPHHRVLTLDNRGVGRSDKPDTPFDVDTMARDVLAVMDAAGVGRSTVLGVSLGGLVAQALYRARPDRISRLVLGCTGPAIGTPGYTPPGTDVVEALRMDRTRASRREVLEAMTPILYHRRYRERVPDLVERLLAFDDALGQPPHGYHRQLDAAFGYRGDSADGLADIGVPTLVLHGADDLVWPIDNARYLADTIPNAYLCIIEDAGHMFMMERPRAFNQAVLEFTDNRDNQA